MDDDDIWNKYRDELIRYASFLGGPDEAEDLLSTVVARTIAQQPLRELDEPKAYLYRALRNESCSAGRRRSREKRLSASLRPAGTYEQYPHVRPSIVAAVQQLPEQQRTASYLYYWRDLSVKETASLMGCGEGSVKRYLFEARKKLQEILK